jgi:hypothetical protein
MERASANLRRGGIAAGSGVTESTRIEPTSPSAPSRVIVRASADFMVQGFAEGIRTYGNMRRVIIMTAILVANVQHITRSATRNWRYARLDDIPPDEERRPVSIKGLAESLGSPFETTRAHVNALIESGICAKVDGGVVVPSHVLASEKVAASNVVLWESFWAMIAGLKAIDFDFAAVTGRRDLDSALVVEPGFTPVAAIEAPRRLVARVTAEFYLNAILGGSIALDGDWTATALFGAIMSMNTETMARDAATAWAYSRADTPPPDSVRRPATIREAADRLGLDKESARRYVHAMVRNGQLTRGDKGYYASMAHMQSPRGRRAATEMTKAFYRMIYDLSALGLRF